MPDFAALVGIRTGSRMGPWIRPGIHLWTGPRLGRWRRAGIRHRAGSYGSGRLRSRALPFSLS